MIFMGTYTMPSDMTDEWVKCMSDMAENQIPSCIKKWQTYTCYGEEGSKGYNLIFTEKGKVDEAFIEINKIMFPFLQIEGSTWKLEPLSRITEAFELLKAQ